MVPLPDQVAATIAGITTDSALQGMPARDFVAGHNRMLDAGRSDSGA